MPHSSPDFAPTEFSGPALAGAADETLATGFQAEAVATDVPYLIFRLGASWFGFPALAVREIHPLPALSPFLETAPWVVGVVDLRGQIVPVMDLKARLGQNPAPYRLDDCLVILGLEGGEIALVVSEVRAVERVSSAQIQAAPLHGRNRDLAAPFLAGVTQIEADIVMLLHPPHLLDERLSGEYLLDGRQEAESRFQSALAHFDLASYSPAERAVLEARAANLRQITGEKGRGQRVPVALIALGGEEFGLALSEVREFVTLRAVTPVPCCPPHILGQVSLRGDIVTLIDVRGALRTARTVPPYFSVQNQANPSSFHTVIVVPGEGGPIGLVIDGVRDVIYLREDERIALHATSKEFASPGGEFFSGGAIYEGRLLPLLDVARLLSEGGFLVDQSI